LKKNTYLEKSITREKEALPKKFPLTKHLKTPHFIEKKNHKMQNLEKKKTMNITDYVMP